MKKGKYITRVAVVQSSSYIFNLKKTMEKTKNLILKAGKKKVNLILFPEAFISGYPRGMTFGTVIGNRSNEGREIWQKYWENSIEVPGPETSELEKYAKKVNSFIAIGVIEKDKKSRGTLYCSLLYFSPDGKLIGKHRKIKPTGAERYIWGEGDGKNLIVFDTNIGRIGGLICWENYMPLARMSLYRYGVELYLAPTADSRKTWISSLTHIACEGRCFVLGCNQFIKKDNINNSIPKVEKIKNKSNIDCRGGSIIISPLGEIIKGPLYDEENILFADLDMKDIQRARFDFDASGHYSRKDIFNLKINNQPPIIKIE